MGSLPEIFNCAKFQLCRTTLTRASKGPKINMDIAVFSQFFICFVLYDQNGLRYGNYDFIFIFSIKILKKKKKKKKQLFSHTYKAFDFSALMTF